MFSELRKLYIRASPPKNASDRRLKKMFKRLSSVKSFFFLLSLANFFLFLLPNAYALEIVNERLFPLKLFITVGVLAALFVALAFSQDLPFFNIAASVMIFFLGFVLMNGQLAYTDGTNEETYIFGNNFTLDDGVTPTYHWDYGSPPKFSQVELDNPETVFLFHSNQTMLYTYWDNSNSHLLGWLLMFVGVILFATTLFGLFSRGDEY